MYKTDHFPVMYKEALDALNVQTNELYIDCNLGLGGHTSLLLERGARVIGIDADHEAIEHCRERFGKELESGTLKILHMNFSKLNEIPLEDKVAGILYDLGLNLGQLKDSARGFSFHDTGELDMRMDTTLGVNAIDLIRLLNEDQLSKLIFEYGEDPQARIFSKAIKIAVKNGKINTPSDLAEVIRKASKYPHSKLHPATRTFQALRIAVNSELDSLRESLANAIPLLKTGGRLVIISFHSLEDEIAKSLAESQQLISITKKPIEASLDEVEKNPPSRSAKMRIYEKQ